MVQEHLAHGTVVSGAEHRVCEVQSTMDRKEKQIQSQALISLIPSCWEEFGEGRDPGSHQPTPRGMDGTLALTLYNLANPSKCIFCDLEHIKSMKMHCPVAAEVISTKKSKRDWMGLLAQRK